MTDNEKYGTFECEGCGTVYPIDEVVLCPTCKTAWCSTCTERVTCVFCGEDAGVFCLECQHDHGIYCLECEEFVCRNTFCIRKHDLKHSKGDILNA